MLGNTLSDLRAFPVVTDATYQALDKARDSRLPAYDLALPKGLPECFDQIRVNFVSGNVNSTWPFVPGADFCNPCCCQAANPGSWIDKANDIRRGAG